MVTGETRGVKTAWFMPAMSRLRSLGPTESSETAGSCSSGNCQTRQNAGTESTLNDDADYGSNWVRWTSRHSIVARESEERSSPRPSDQFDSRHRKSPL